MRTRLAWALPLLLLLSSCERRSTAAPDESGSSSSSRRAAKRGVEPIEVCEHLANVAAAEAGLSKPPINEQLMSECESDLTLEAGTRGTDNWNSFAGCVLQSRSAAELEQCNRSYPLPSPGGVVASDGARELEVCEHMIHVLMLETAAQSGEVPPVSVEERGVLVEECARALLTEQKPSRSAPAYLELLECIELAQSSELMHACH